MRYILDWQQLVGCTSKTHLSAVGTPLPRSPELVKEPTSKMAAVIP